MTGTINAGRSDGYIPAFAANKLNEEWIHDSIGCLYFKNGQSVWTDNVHTSDGMLVVHIRNKAGSKIYAFAISSEHFQGD